MIKRYNDLSFEEKKDLCEVLDRRFNEIVKRHRDYGETDMVIQYNKIRARRSQMYGAIVIPDTLESNPPIDTVQCYVYQQNAAQTMSVYNAMYSRKTKEARQATAAHQEMLKVDTELMTLISKHIQSRPDFDSTLLYNIITQQHKDNLFICARS